MVYIQSWPALTDRPGNYLAPGGRPGRQQVNREGRTNEPTMSFRINDIAFQLVLYSRFEVVAVEVRSAQGRPACAPGVKVPHHPLFPCGTTKVLTPGWRTTLAGVPGMDIDVGSEWGLS